MKPFLDQCGTVLNCNADPLKRKKKTSETETFGISIALIQIRCIAIFYVDTDIFICKTRIRNSLLFNVTQTFLTIM